MELWIRRCSSDGSVLTFFLSLEYLTDEHLQYSPRRPEEALRTSPSSSSSSSFKLTMAQVIYRFLTAGTMDEKIFQRQITKLGLSGSLMVRPFLLSSFLLSCFLIADEIVNRTLRTRRVGQAPRETHSRTTMFVPSCLPLFAWVLTI